MGRIVAHKARVNVPRYASPKSQTSKKNAELFAELLTKKSLSKQDKEKLDEIVRSQEDETEKAQAKRLLKEVPLLKRVRRELGEEFFRQLAASIIESIESAHKRGFNAAPKPGPSVNSGREDTFTPPCPYHGASCHPHIPGPSGLW